MLTKNIIRFIVLILVQTLGVNHINFGGFLNPYIYVLFILLLPFEIPGWLLLILSFVLGISVDIFSNTPGIHAAASTFMAFCRPGVLRILAGNKEYEQGMKPNLVQMGFNWFLAYTLLLVFLHHLFFFLTEDFRLSEILSNLTRIFLSTAFSSILILLLMFIFSSRKS